MKTSEQSTGLMRDTTLSGHGRLSSWERIGVSYAGNRDHQKLGTELSQFPLKVGHSPGQGSVNLEVLCSQLEFLVLLFLFLRP